MKRFGGHGLNEPDFVQGIRLRHLTELFRGNFLFGLYDLPENGEWSLLLKNTSAWRQLLE